MNVGHEHARSAVRDFLQARVPAFLAIVRERTGEDSPKDPVAYLLLDEFPEDEQDYPCIVVRSTSAERGKVVAAQAAGESVDREFLYHIEVLVGTVRREFSRAVGNDSPAVKASTDRDRLMLAVRWALRSPGDLDESTAVIGALSEDTGPAQQMLDGKPIAAGTFNFDVSAIEDVPVLDPAQPIASHALAVDASLT